MRRIEMTQDLATCYRLRHRVFVEEQGVPVEEEIDALDPTAIHLLALQDGGPAGTARIVLSDGTAKIGRVCVLPEARGSGLGADLIRAAVEIARQTPNTMRVVLGAQVHALAFYQKLGFTAFGRVYDDAGIDHRDMEMTL